MRTIGILGGMSAASTQIYYRRLCQGTRDRLGGLHSPELIIRSVDFERIERLQMAGEWAVAGALLNREALALQRSGADFLILATNTMHKVAEQIMRNVSLPLLHIADATANAVQKHGLHRPGLLATAFTMEETFYSDRLAAAGLGPLVPGPDDRVIVQRTIYEELCQDLVLPTSEQVLLNIIKGLKIRGADCLILACTELGMLLNQSNVSLPLFDTALIHCDAALDFMLS